MEVKAVDVVLLPSEAVSAAVVEANGRLVEKFGSEIVLDEANCLPHISLCMGVLDEKDMSEVEKILKKIAGDFARGDLGAGELVIGENSVGEKVSLLEIEKSERLCRLHEVVTERVGEYLSNEVSGEMIYGGRAAESTLKWIRDYKEKSSWENFRPHITVGYGVLEDGGLPERVAADRIAMCYLGDHCTCREVICDFNLERV